MIPLLTAAEMRAADRSTIEGLGLPATVLMEHAGRAVADEVIARTAPGAWIAVLCGPGNNGGDGFVCARWLLESGRRPRVYLVAGRPAPGGEAELHLGVLERAGVIPVAADEAATVACLPEILRAGAIVDAMLGTGLSRAVDGDLAGFIDALARAAGPVISVDIPSGLHADTGAVLGAAVRAAATVTFGFAKVGLFSHPGCERAGQVTVADIGIPRRLAVNVGCRLALLERQDAAALVPRRAQGAHKGTSGHLLVAAGSPGRAGAALLVAKGAFAGGAGLVTIAAPAAARTAIDGRVAEAMSVSLEAGSSLDELLALVADKRAVAWGPGMPTDAAAGDLLRAAIPRLHVPFVLDADALNHLGDEPELVAAAAGPAVLTPHPGEAARLLGVGVTVISADRVAAARQLAARSNAVVVLKGARTVIASPGGSAVINPTGNPGLGTAGAGDVLCGLIGALLAQGLTSVAAATLGAYVHGLAADMLARRTPQGYRAGDVARTIPAAMARLGQKK